MPILRAYNRLLDKRPLLTQMVTSSLIASGGDVMAQFGIERRSLKEYDPSRTARFFVLIGGIVAPCVSRWFLILERIKGGHPKLVPLKRLACDQILWAPGFSAFILLSLRTLEGHTPSESWAKCKKEWLTIYTNGLKLWPAANLINFYLVPLKYRVIYVQFVAFFWNAFLSYTTQTQMKEHVIEEEHLDVVPRMQFIRAYQRSLSRRPLLTQMLTSGFMTSAGDVTAQLVIEKRPVSRYDPLRTARFFVLTAGFSVPVFSRWMLLLERLKRGRPGLVPLKRLACDQLLFAPVFNASVLVILRLLQGCTVEQAVDRCKNQWWDIQRTSYKVFPLSNLINFYLVPLPYRVIHVQFVALFWNTYLSYETQESIEHHELLHGIGLHELAMDTVSSFCSFYRIILREWSPLRPLTTTIRLTTISIEHVPHIKGINSMALPQQLTRSLRLLAARNNTHRMRTRTGRAMASPMVLRVSSTTTNANDKNGRMQEKEVCGREMSRYEEAVQRLNLLQSNAATIQKMKEKRDAMQLQNLPETVGCLRRIGIEPADLNQLRVVHVTGTKGKGSTCAYVEAILRSCGLSTGFFSSPHMVHVRERIRLNGQPMSEGDFAETLISVYDTMLQNHQSDSEFAPLPAYFKFLTIMAFEVFLREKVDVAIMEVGIGGEYDCTNVIPSPVVCGMTTLDLDHTAILGERLVDIAWNKTGIFKKGAVAVVSGDQEDGEVVRMIRKRAEERQVASLSVAPSLSSYGLPDGCTLQVGIDGDHQKTNVSLALQLARSWLRRERPEKERALFDGHTEWIPGEPFTIPRPWLAAIATCHWPGRSQVLEVGRRRFFLDGAHTVKSMKSCVAWFREAANLGGKKEKRSEGGGTNRELTLLFHCTGDRRPETLMSELASLPFSRVLLCPPLIQPRPPASSDGANFFRPHCEQTRQSMECESAWRRLRPDMEEERTRRFECVTDALRAVGEGAEEADILVSGSLILVGNVLSVLGYNK